MSNSPFKIGDVVTHKTTANWNAPLRMTVHSFVNSGGGASGTDTSSWVLCKWYNADKHGFDKEVFHVNEIQAIV